MPKETRVSSLSSDRTRTSPYPLRPRNAVQKEPESPLQSEGVKEWEQTRCPICMESPHNAILLRCSSFEKGCRPYMCDTTSRHSNCYKQYRKNSRFDMKNLRCPLCRGEVYGTMKVKGARRFMNAKPRSCSSESCNFSGTYAQLMKHAKAEHPDVNPTKVDAVRQHNWESMERETDYADMLSSMHVPFVGEGQENQNYGFVQVQRWVSYTYTDLEATLGTFMDNMFGEIAEHRRSRLRVYNSTGAWEYNASYAGGWIP